MPPRRPLAYYRGGHHMLFTSRRDQSAKFCKGSIRFMHLVKSTGLEYLSNNILLGRLGGRVLEDLAP
ncbi:hypothetical protein Mapa_017009 [Marchantia paleacea]|nr:hypothetical protein Mapa_017009 [Marchantia paleacea]